MFDAVEARVDRVRDPQRPLGVTGHREAEAVRLVADRAQFRRAVLRCVQHRRRRQGPSPPAAAIAARAELIVWFAGRANEGPFSEINALFEQVLLCHRVIEGARGKGTHMTTNPTSVDDLTRLAQTWDQGTWCLAALALSFGEGVPDGHLDAANALLTALALHDPASLTSGNPGDSRAAKRIAGQAKASLLQIAAMLSGGTAWADQPDDVLLAHGRASARRAQEFTQVMLSNVEGLADRLAAPGARMLDVGVGVAAMAVYLCEEFPSLTVVGIDVLPKALRLAAHTLANSDVADRVILREQDVAELAELDRFDLAWLPAPFLPEPALRQGLVRVKRALKPGGWLMVGHGKFGDNPLDDALTRLKTVAFGGTVLDHVNAQARLKEIGLTEVRTVPTPPGIPAFTIGQRQASAGCNKPIKTHGANPTS